MRNFLSQCPDKRYPVITKLLAFVFVLVCLGPIWPSYFFTSQTIFSNSIGMSFVLVPKGQFFMGNKDSTLDLVKDFPKYEVHRIAELDDERPFHQVKISKNFYMGKTEVTVGQFSHFLSETNYVPESIKDGTGAYGYSLEHDKNRKEVDDAFAGRDTKYSLRNPGFDQSSEHPVVNVSWNDAVAMADWLTKKEGVRYRLPTEAEWEYACLANKQKRYSSSDNPEELSKLANIFDKDATSRWRRWGDFALESHDGYSFTSPVGSFRANAFGLHDMVGNVWEWVSDNYDDAYYYHSDLTDPQGPDSSNVKVRRGGSWHTWSLYARCSYRNYNTPSSRYPLLGFRLVREAG
jgi:formylglycine-generating enzyme required for sulfatase activity